MTDQPWGDVIPWTKVDREWGECPVPDDETVMVILSRETPDAFVWARVGKGTGVVWDNDTVCPIIAYRRKAQPKWVTVYGSNDEQSGWVFSENPSPVDTVAFRFLVGLNGAPCGDMEWVEIKGAKK